MRTRNRWVPPNFRYEGEMQPKQAPRVTGASSRIGLKVFLCSFLLPVLLVCASAQSASGSRITLNGNVLPYAKVSVPYSATVKVQGGTAPYQFAFERGTIPPGLHLN